MSDDKPTTWVVHRDLAKFVLAACSDPLAMRPSREKPWVVEVRGRTWVVSTDGHRMHAVAAPPGLPLGYVDVRTDGAITPCPDWKHEPPSATHVWQEQLERDLKPVEIVRLRAAASGNEDTAIALGHGDDLARPRCLTRWCPSGTSTCVAAHYMREGLLAAPRATKKFPDPGITLVAHAGPLDPVLVVDAQSGIHPEWRAILMPVQW